MTMLAGRMVSELYSVCPSWSTLSAKSEGADVFDSPRPQNCIYVCRR